MRDPNCRSLRVYGFTGFWRADISVWQANRDPTGSTEPGKSCPGLIGQAQALLDAGQLLTLIIPLTTSVVADAKPLRVRVPASGRLRHRSDLLVDQLRAIDNRRLVR